MEQQRQELYDLAGTLQQGGFTLEHQPEVFARSTAAVLLRPNLGAKEYIASMDFIRDLSMEMAVQLAIACSPCIECNDFCYYRQQVAQRLVEADMLDDDDDFYDDCWDDELHIPDELLEEAGIKPGTNLEAEIEEGRITFTASPPGIESAPLHLVGCFYQSGICLADLNRMIVANEVIQHE